MTLLEKNKRTRVDKRVFWPQYFRKIECVCLYGFILKLSKRYHMFLEMTSELLTCTCHRYGDVTKQCETPFSVIFLLFLHVHVKN